ncbi:MAG: ABC transporter permease [Deltaproteobacteria bacterium]|nr:ABC transporter permease [Deltaproteobacteria bacterium]
MIKIWAIALNTFREAVRDKILYSLLFFALLMIGSSVLIAELIIGEYGKIIRDIGLAAISIFGLLIAVFVGIGLIYKEIERKTIYTIASKPVPRWQFLVGKYFGLLGTLATEVAIMAVAYVLVLNGIGAGTTSAMLPAIWLTFMELAVVTAIAILFGSFTSPVLSALFTVGLTLIGKMSEELVLLGQRSESGAVRFLMDTVYKVLPDLSRFDLRTQASYGLEVEWEYVAYATGYGAAYAAALLVLASIIFRFRDFK